MLFFSLALLYKPMTCVSYSLHENALPNMCQQLPNNEQQFATKWESRAPLGFHLQTKAGPFEVQISNI